MLSHGLRRRSRTASMLLAVAVLLTTAAGCGSSSKTAAQPPAKGGATSAAPATSAPREESAAARAFKLPEFAAPPAAEPITISTTGPLAPIYHRLPVHQKVAFLTMDDGQVQLPVAAALMKAANVPFTMFLIAPVAAGNPPFFKQLAAEGGVIEDHTLTHPSMRGLSYARQRHEICGARDSLHTTFGITPRFFRPPYGNYDSNTLRAVHDCGLQAAFHWSETVNNGKVYYQTPIHKVQAGDIILMHFRPAFVKDVVAALTAIHNAGLTPALLENYINVN